MHLAMEFYPRVAEVPFFFVILCSYLQGFATAAGHVDNRWSGMGHCDVKSGILNENRY